MRNKRYLTFVVHAHHFLVYRLEAMHLHAHYTLFGHHFLIADKRWLHQVIRVKINCVLNCIVVGVVVRSGALVATRTIIALAMIH